MLKQHGFGPGHHTDDLYSALATK